MHGRTPTIQDIVLEELPEPISLQCEEEMLDSSDEEDARDCVHEQLAEQAQQAFRVVTTCGVCYCAVRLVVLCDDAHLRQLQQLLLDDLSIVCPGCA
nr:E7 [human papillomavirus 89]